MRFIEGKKIKFIALDRKYRTEPYPAVAPLDSKINNYITGQHRDFNEPKTKGFLTLNEITGKEKITPEARRKKFAYLITQDTEVKIIHNKTYDTRLDDKGEPLNPKDYWDAQFIINQERLVAMSKREATPKHKFYLEDKEAEAKAFVVDADEKFEAEKLIREQSISEYKDFILLLNMIEPGFYVDYKSMNDTRLKQVLISKAHEKPSVIKQIFTDRGKDLMFIAKIVNADIIQYKPGTGFYDNGKFIAANYNDMVHFMNESKNETLLGKWNRLLEQEEE